MTTEQISVISLCISFASAFFALGGLAWQVILYRLSGARIIVKIRPIKLDSLGTTLAGPEKGWSKQVDLSKFNQDEWIMDIVEVKITNAGRTAVSISDVSLDIGRIGRGRHTIRGNPVEILGGSTKRTLRLNPGEEESTFFDLWLTIGSTQKEKGITIVRGSATPAGRRSKRSPWTKRWKIRHNQEDLDPNITVTPELRAYRALWQELRKQNRISADIAWSMIYYDLKPKNWSLASLKETLTQVMPLGSASASYQIWSAYQGIENNSSGSAESQSPESHSTEVEILNTPTKNPRKTESPIETIGEPGGAEAKREDS